jgi:transposase
MLDLLQRYPSPAAMKAAGTTRLATRLVKRAPRMGRLAEDIARALSEQTVVVVGTNAAATVLPRLPRLPEQLAALRRQRSDIAVEVENLVDAHPLSPVLTSMPGVGVRTAARLLTEVTGKHFETAGHLAAYAGLAPVTRRSGLDDAATSSSRYSATAPSTRPNTPSLLDKNIAAPPVKP